MHYTYMMIVHVMTIPIIWYINSDVTSNICRIVNRGPSILDVLCNNELLKHNQ